MNTLQDLTGQESGIVVYENEGRPQAIVCNWASIQGWPRLDPFGIAPMGLGEDIPEADRCERVDAETIRALLDGAEVVYANGEDAPDAGRLFRFEGIAVLAPDDWA
jgi:hypothetical protein